MSRKNIPTDCFHLGKQRSNPVPALGLTPQGDAVAKDVASATLVNYVSSHGCQQVHGYLFAKPMSGGASPS